MVEEVQITMYKTFDGEKFETREAAKKHEDEHFTSALLGLTVTDLDAALRRDPTHRHISDALEKAGNVIEKIRTERDGEFRRARNGVGRRANGESRTDAEILGVGNQP